MLHQMEMKHDIDPKQAILDQIGDISGLEIFGNLVLVGTYVRPETTKGGIILTDKMKAEDFYQGKVGLVLKVGPSAFKNDAYRDFSGQSVQVGDWVMYRTMEAPSFGLNGHHCRWLEDIHVRCKIPHPDMVF